MTEKKNGQPPFIEKCINNLKFKTNKISEREENGKKVKVYFPATRGMKIKDVLAFSDKGTHIIIVSADGQKHKVKK